MTPDWRLAPGRDDTARWATVRGQWVHPRLSVAVPVNAGNRPFVLGGVGKQDPRYQKQAAGVSWNPDMADCTNSVVIARSRSYAEELATTLTRYSVEIFVLGHVIDLATTYRLTPNLSQEVNVISSHHGLGWTYILLAAVLSTVALQIASSWMWRHVVNRFPRNRRGYMQFYSCILFGTLTGRHNDYQVVLVGALLGLSCILSYVLIASKLLSCGWNLLFLANFTPLISTMSFLVLKYVLAMSAGLSMFFIFPYWLHRSIHAQFRST